MASDSKSRFSKKNHNKVIKVLYDLSKNYGPYEKVFADHISTNYKCINILSRHNRGAAEVYPYYPDLWCKYKKNNKIDIFEVWDNQTKEACAEDILFSALTPNVEVLYIICLQKDQYELARKLVRVILSSLFNEDSKPLLSESYVLRYVKLVPQNVINDENKLRDFLQKELEY